MNILSVSILLAIGFVTISAAPNCPAVNEEIATLLPHESDCTKFYKCETGVAIVYDCPAGLYFNPVLSVCDFPEEAGCGGSGGSTSPTEGTTDGGSGGSTGGGSGGSTGGGSTGGGGTGGPQCPAEDGEFVTLLPHEDCTKFWKCDRGVAVEKDCPAGLYFNPSLSVCDFPEDAGCDGTGTGGGTTPSPTQGTTDGGSGGSTGGGSGGSTGGGSTGGGGTGGPQCPAEDGEFVTLLPHEDCTKFWKCDRGVAVEKDCPAGLYFNPSLSVCDFPEDAGCDGTGTGGGTTPSPTQGTTDGGSGGSTGGGSTGGGGTGGPQCPAEDGEFVTLLPHEDCTKFWKCDRGVAVEKDCPAGLYFNPSLSVCDYPEDAGCDGTGTGGGTTPSPTQGTTDGGSGGSTGGGSGGSTGGGSTGGGGTGGTQCPAEDGEFVTLLPHEDCTKFWKCDSGVAVEMDCPAGLYFNPSLSVCDFPEDAGCDGTGTGGGTTPSPTQGTTDGGSGGSTGGGSGGSTGGGSTGGGGTGGTQCPAEDGEFVTLLPHEDCTKFWKCDSGVAVEMDCPAGLYFNPSLSVCDFPEDAGCDGTGTGGGTTPSPTQGTTDGGSGGSTGGGNGGSTGGGSTGGGGTGGTQCPAVDGEFVTLLPHEDCTKFWKCDSGVAVEMDCPAGLYFNPSLSVCDFPEDAGCDGTGTGGGTTPSPTQGTTDGGSGGTTGGGSGGSTGGGSTGGGGTGGPQCPAEDGEFVTLLPHEDCTKFWKCDRGVAVEKDCPAGLYFNPSLSVCDFPEDAGCDGTGTGGGTTPSPTQGTTDGGSGGSTGGGSTGGGSTGGGGTGGPQCPAVDGEFVTLFPHEDCTKFWKCDRGVAVEKDCPAGLYFNPSLSVCDYPEDAGCDGTGTGGGTTPSPTQGTTDGGSGGSTGGGSTGGGGTGGPQCPAIDGEFVTLFPHEDCTKFWKCDRGVAVEKDCPAGLYFNPSLSVCDYPEDSGCDGTGTGGGTTPSPTQGTTDGGSGGSTGGGTTGGDGPTTSNPNDGYCQTLSCPELNGEWVYFIPFPGDCRRFCKCDWGIPFEFTCPSDLFFDPILDVCDYQENVACSNA